MREPEPVPCALCGRSFSKKSLTRHHLVPRQHGGHGGPVIDLCRQCHGMVHARFQNKTLASQYPTIQQLRKAPELQAYLKWVRKQPSTSLSRNRPARRRS